MMRAYDKSYLNSAEALLGRMLDVAVYDLNQDLTQFFERFAASEIARFFENGDSSLLAGTSGAELAWELAGRPEQECVGETNGAGGAAQPAQAAEETFAEELAATTGQELAEVPAGAGEAQPAQEVGSEFAQELAKTTGEELAREPEESAAAGAGFAWRFSGKTFSPRYTETRSAEYWAGGLLAYVQWSTALSFAELTEYVPVQIFLNLFDKYHDFDYSCAAEEIVQAYRQAKTDTNLKLHRKRAGLSQGKLAQLSGVPVRTVQQYEQRQKNINAARAEAVISMARVLGCRPDELLELE